MKKRQALSTLLWLSLLLPSCGYHPIDSDDKTTVSVPYVQGDQQGQLTSILIHELDRSGLYDFVRGQGELTLKVAVIGDNTETVGYKYDRGEVSGKIEKNLMSTENRRNVTVEVTIVNHITNEIVVGPVQISAGSDYDFIDVSSLRELSFITPTGKREKVVDFSLGQLDSVEGAQDTAMTPIYRQLARKIVLMLQKASS